MFHTFCGVEKTIIKNYISGPHKKCQTGGNFIHGNVIPENPAAGVSGTINQIINQENEF